LGQGDGRKEAGLGGWEEGGRDRGMGAKRAGYGDEKKESREEGCDEGGRDKVMGRRRAG